MQACKEKKSIYKFMFLAALSIFAGNIFAQEKIEMPAFPEITQPTLGGDFYKPQIPYYPKKNVQQKNKEQQQQQTSVREQTISSANEETALINSIFNQSVAQILTASDISMLSDSGVFSNISSLYNTPSVSSQNLTSNVLLQQILTNLEELKKQQIKNPDDQNESFSDKQQNAQTFKTRTPSILRFKINGYDLLDSLTTVFISESEPDGTFLLTADRRYVADNKIRNETFYLFFKTQEGKGHSTAYSVVPKVTQDFKNENSFIYRLSKSENLMATKTGNLVVLNSTTKDLSIDLLLDIDSF